MKGEAIVRRHARILRTDGERPAMKPHSVG